MSDAPYVRVKDDGVVEYRASALGGCDMALLAARLGYDAVPLKADAKIMKAFERGHYVEEQLLKDYVHVADRQQEVYLDVTRRLKVIGHIDGFDEWENAVVEVKSQNKDAWDAFEKDHWSAGLFPKYKWQVSCYMLAYDAPLKLIRVLVDDSGEMQAIKPSYVEEPFYTMTDIRNRVLRVEAAAATGVLSAECTPSFPCPYFYLHEEIDRELIGDETIDALAHEYEDARAATAAARGKQEAAKRALREASSSDKYTTASGVRVTFYRAKNPPRLDKELLVPFLEKHDRSLDQFMMQGESERLRVTLPKVDEIGENESSSADES